MSISDPHLTLSSADLRADLSLALGAAYIIDRELGNDGMSRVFVAHEESFDRDVLIKALSRKYTRGLSAERFSKALARAGSSDDPHTVPILTAGETTDGLFFYTMPFVRADSLRNRIEAGPVGFFESVAALRDVARAMAYAHARDIYHHNLTPEKVLLAKNGALVVEFGLVRALALAGASLDRGTPPAGLSFSPLPYRAPELMAGNPAADHRADIYAWGVMACELLLDADPHANALADDPSRPGDVPPLLLFKRHGVPEQLALLVMRCCDRNPSARPAAADDLVDALERIPDPSLALALESKSATRWIGLSMVGALGLFVLSGAAVYKMQRRETRNRPVLAVLPFVSSGVVGDSLFAEGVELGVTAKLIQLVGVRVIERRSVLAVADEGGTAQSMGRALGAGHVLQTSLRWLRDPDGSVRVRISPVLVDVRTGKTKWVNEPLIASPADPFAPQRTIARQAAQELAVFLGDDENAILDARPTRDTAAFAAMVRGSRVYPFVDVLLAGSHEAALREFERAYQIDPQYADALGGAALLLARVGQASGQPQLLDSAATLARRALAIDPGHERALLATARVALARERTASAEATVEGVVARNPSSIQALRLRTELLPLLGDTARAWRDVQHLAQLAPRSADALIVSATTAQALRRFGDAYGFLKRAGELEPNRPDLMLRIAMLARAAGDFSRAAGALREYRRRGGRLTADHLYIVRTADSTIRKEIAEAVPETFYVASRGDSITFYIQKGLYHLDARNTPRARTLFDSAATLLVVRPDDPRLSASLRRRYGELRAWTDAARGQRERAQAAVSQVERTPIAQQWPNGQLAALTACNGAEIYGFLDDVEHMIAQLRRCLTLPGGYAPSSVAAEPAIWRHAPDPRLRALLGEFNLQILRRQ